VLVQVSFKAIKTIRKVIMNVTLCLVHLTVVILKKQFVLNILIGYL